MVQTTSTVKTVTLSNTQTVPLTMSSISVSGITPSCEPGCRQGRACLGMLIAGS